MSPFSHHFWDAQQKIRRTVSTRPVFRLSRTDEPCGVGFSSFFQARKKDERIAQLNKEREHNVTWHPLAEMSMCLLFSLAGFKGNLSLLDVFLITHFSRGQKRNWKAVKFGGLEFSWKQPFHRFHLWDKQAAPLGNLETLEKGRFISEKGHLEIWFGFGFEYLAYRFRADENPPTSKPPGSKPLGG